MKLLLVTGFVALIALLLAGRRQPGLRIPAVLLAVILLSLAVVSMVRKPEAPMAGFYRSIDGAAGYVLANRMLEDLSDTASGTVALIQFLHAGDPIDSLTKEQRRGVERALEGTGLRLVVVGPDARTERYDDDDGTVIEGSSPWREKDLVAWLEAAGNPVAIISFVGVPNDLGREVSWPPVYALQLDAQVSFHDVMARGVVKAVARTHGGISPLSIPAGIDQPEDLFALRYELVTDSSDL
ncbi:MAG: hypothetical protein ACO398_07970 [Kiritimatiellia bacterium]